MEITVAEILKSDFLKGAKVIAGKKGLYRPVSSVTVGEVPDIADWLKGGEAVLTTLYAVSEDPQAQLEFVRKIVDSPAAALLIKPGRFVKNLNQDIVKTAKEADFPLIEVPQDVRWTDLVRDIYDSMIKTEVEIRMKGDLIDDLLAGQFKADELVRRASFLGADLSAGSLAMYTDVDSLSAAISKNNLDEQAVQKLKREILNAATWVVRSYSRNSLISLKSDNVIIFLTPPEGRAEVDIRQDSVRLAEEIKNSFSARFKDVTISVGLGRFYPSPEQMIDTLEEARTALSIGRTLGRVDSITMFDDVGTYKLLLRAYEQEPAELQLLYSESVAPLVAYDRQHKSDLVATLECFLRNDRNLNATAEELYAHRHTVRYRLERIAGISGLNVDKSEDLERLSLGLKAMRLLGGLNPDSVT
ncbi:MAG: PucR family transcriptional regulator ligand-binding domain-containing protein [Actinomycetota bacterium]